MADAGSISAAAERLHVSQPALSARLKELEASLKAELFIRHPRGVLLTEAGRTLLPHAREVVAAMHRAEHALDRLPEQVSVRLGVTPTLGLIFVPELLRNCSAASGIELVVRQGPAALLLELLEQGRADAVVSYASARAGAGFVLPLFEEDLVLFGPPDLVSAADGDIDFHALAGVGIVIEPVGHLLRRKLDDASARCGVGPVIVAEVEPLAAKLSLMRRNKLCTIAPDWLFAQEVRSGILQARRIRDPALTLRLSLTMRTNLPAETASKLRGLVETTVDQLSASQASWRSIREA